MVRRPGDEREAMEVHYSCLFHMNHHVKGRSGSSLFERLRSAFFPWCKLSNMRFNAVGGMAKMAHWFHQLGDLEELVFQ